MKSELKKQEEALCWIMNKRLKKKAEDKGLKPSGIRSTAIPPDWPMPQDVKKEIGFYI